MITEGSLPVPKQIFTLLNINFFWEGLWAGCADRANTKPLDYKTTWLQKSLLGLWHLPTNLSQQRKDEEVGKILSRSNTDLQEVLDKFQHSKEPRTRGMRN